MNLLNRRYVFGIVELLPIPPVAAVDKVFGETFHVAHRIERESMFFTEGLDSRFSAKGRSASGGRGNDRGGGRR